MQQNPETHSLIWCDTFEIWSTYFQSSYLGLWLGYLLPPGGHHEGGIMPQQRLFPSLQMVIDLIDLRNCSESKKDKILLKPREPYTWVNDNQKVSICHWCQISCLKCTKITYVFRITPSPKLCIDECAETRVPPGRPELTNPQIIRNFFFFFKWRQLPSNRTD